MVETFASLGLPPAFQELLDRRLAQTRRDTTDDLEQIVERRVQECVRVLHGHSAKGLAALQKDFVALQSIVQELGVGIDGHASAIVLSEQRFQNDVVRIQSDVQALRSELDSIQARLKRARADDAENEVGALAFKFEAGASDKMKRELSDMKDAVSQQMREARRNFSDDLVNARSVILSRVCEQVDGAFVAFRAELRTEMATSLADARSSCDKRFNELQEAVKSVGEESQTRCASQTETIRESSAEMCRVEKMVHEGSVQLALQARQLSDLFSDASSKAAQQAQSETKALHCELRSLEQSVFQAQQDLAAGLQRLEARVANQSMMGELMSVDATRDCQRRIHDIEGQWKDVQEFAKLTRSSQSVLESVAAELSKQQEDAKKQLSALELSANECSEEQASWQSRIKRVERVSQDIDEHLRQDLEAKLANMSSRFNDSQDSTEMQVRRYASAHGEFAEQQQHQLAIRFDGFARSIKAEQKELAAQVDAKDVRYLSEQRTAFEQIGELFSARSESKQSPDAGSDSSWRSDHRGNDTARRCAVMERALDNLEHHIAANDKIVEEHLNELGRELGQRGIVDQDDLQQTCIFAARKADEAAARSVVLQSELSSAELALEMEMRSEMREIQAEMAARLHEETSQEFRECRLAAASARTSHREKTSDQIALENRVNNLNRAISSSEVGRAAEQSSLEHRIDELGRTVARLEKQPRLEHRIDELGRTVARLEQQPRAEPSSPSAKSPARSARLREELFGEVARADENTTARLRGDLSADIRRVEDRVATADEQISDLRKQQEQQRRQQQQQSPQDLLNNMRRDVATDMQCLDERLAALDEQVLFLRGEIAPDALGGILERSGHIRRAADEAVGEQIARFRRRWGADVEWQLECLSQCLQTLYAKAGIASPQNFQSLLQRQQ